MADTLPRRPSPFDVQAVPEDDGTFTISKLKATSESLRCFNDALARIGEAETEDDADQPAYRMSASPWPAKSPS